MHTTLQAQAFEILAQCGTQLLALTLHLFALVLIGQHHLLGNVTTVLIVFIVVIKVVLQTQNGIIVIYVYIIYMCVNHFPLQ